MKRLVRLAVFALFIIAAAVFCNKQEGVDEQTYRASIDRWHKERVARLTKPEGWLSLAGLYWLKEGENTFGFGRGHDIEFPGENGQAQLGSFLLHEGKVSVILSPQAQVLVDSQFVLQSELKDDLQGRPTRMERGRYLWYVIKRGERFGIRLKDRQNPKIKQFKGIKRFPVDLKWRIKARFVPYDSVRMVMVPTVLGTQAPSRSPGELEFTMDGRTFRLQALADSPNEPLFIIFSDETNGRETYGAGRFLETEAVNQKGETIIDFNKAYNPPCAFTEYATCPLPPAQNHLPVRITAGEMIYEDGH
ncbi:DUF1684 domain-containing protein [Caldithrix abyssi]